MLMLGGHNSIEQYEYILRLLSVFAVGIFQNRLSLNIAVRPWMLHCYGCHRMLKGCVGPHVIGLNTNNCGMFTNWL